MMLDKHAFIRYMISQHTFKNNKTVWVLNFLAHNEIHLDDLHFVEDVTGCPRRLIFSTHDCNTPPLLFCDEEGETSSAENIIERIIKQKGEPFYIQANFSKWQGNRYYLKVLEDNPFMNNLPYQEEVSQFANELIQHIQKETLRERLAEKIDFALDTKNQSLFDELTNKLAELDGAYEI